MKFSSIIGLIAGTVTSSVMAQDIPEHVSKEDSKAESGYEQNLSLFDDGNNEDPNLLAIKEMARDLRVKSGLLMKIAEIQQDLISFADTDLAAAYQSRYPFRICKNALEERFCNAMTGTFQKE